MKNLAKFLIFLIILTFCALKTANGSCLKLLTTYSNCFNNSGLAFANRNVDLADSFYEEILAKTYTFEQAMKFFKTIYTTFDSNQIEICVSPICQCVQTRYPDVMTYAPFFNEPDSFNDLVRILKPLRFNYKPLPIEKIVAETSLDRNYPFLNEFCINNGFSSEVSHYYSEIAQCKARLTLENRVLCEVRHGTFENEKMATKEERTNTLKCLLDHLGCDEPLKSIIGLHMLIEKESELLLEYGKLEKKKGGLMGYVKKLSLGDGRNGSKKYADDKYSSYREDFALNNNGIRVLSYVYCLVLVLLVNCGYLYFSIIS